MPPQDMPKKTKSQIRRAQYLLLALQGCNDAAIRRELGISDRGFKARLVKQLKQHASILDAPRSGRPIKYTEELHESARQVLLDLEDTVVTGKEFVWTLEDRGILKPETSPKSYMRSFKRYLATKGMQLSYGRRRLLFALSNSHIKARLKWCREKSSIFTKEKVKQYWFGDEISISTGMAPKGKYQFLSLSAALHVAASAGSSTAMYCLEYCSAAVQCTCMQYSVLALQNRAWVGVAWWGSAGICATGSVHMQASMVTHAVTLRNAHLSWNCPCSRALQWAALAHPWAHEARPAALRSQGGATHLQGGCVHQVRVQARGGGAAAQGAAAQQQGVKQGITGQQQLPSQHG